MDVTILEVIQRSADFLGKRGVGAPRLQVELLLAHVLKMPRMNLYLNFERALSAQEVETLRELVRGTAGASRCSILSAPFPFAVWN